MEGLGQLKQLLLGEKQEGAYECLACHARFEYQYQVCPECEGYDIRRTEWVDERPCRKRV